ncbi:rhamnosyltransferase WsaF family glycosyltransferase [Pseudogemmobacter sonorensis]|uniref:rhamnosyltransferase WsaF family glycosyltransferase n=1 Tax=Pseudogemmobacter sonorensis TaxID=2989681 RepID=UPI00369FCDFD
MPQSFPASPTICVVLAVYRPDPAFLDAQIASIAAQELRPGLVVAVIADCMSDTLAREGLERHGLAHHIARPAAPLEAVNAFQFGLQAALGLMPGDALFALSDQDDIWHPDRLSAGAAELKRSGADLVHSDARVIDGAGREIHPSVFRFERRLRHPKIHDLLYRNTVTGMAVLMRRRLVELSLPFPRQSGVHFYHDLWLALLASATGGIALIDRPLVDYRQHGGNAIGAVDRTRRGLKTRLRLPDMTWIRREAAAYGRSRYLALSAWHRLNSTHASNGAAAENAKLRPLRRYMRRLRGAESHIGDGLRYLFTGHADLARLAFGAALVATGRAVWSLRDALTHGITRASEQFDARLFSLSPGVQPTSALPEADPRVPMGLGELVDGRKTPSFAPDFSAEAPAVVVLVPTLNPTEIFAGIATAVDLGLALAAEGLRVRFIATDLPISAPNVSSMFLTSRLTAEQAATGAAARITLHCGRTEPTIPAHRDDRFLATAWWTAMVATRLIQEHGYQRHRFLYLIQDFEPGFYPWGAEHADALASYALDFVPIFNTSLLRDYFAAQGYGFARPDSLTFRPSIDIDRYAGMARSPQTPRRIAIYGRPEVARNLFPTAIEAINRFLQRAQIRPEDVVIESVGLRHAPVRLDGGHVVISRGKLPYEDYPAYLAGVDVGLSLMLSPHPSHPPLEMAAAGARVVTNTFGGKNLSGLSTAILSVAPEAHALCNALSNAWNLGPATLDERRIDLAPLGATLVDTARELAPLALPLLRRPEGRRRVIVHNGAPKCGSTFLQRVLLQNRERLARASIAYPEPPTGHPGNGMLVPDLDRARLERDFGEAHTLIYSHEDLLTHPGWVERLSRLAREMDLELEFLTFLRPMPELIFGAYSQTVKQRLHPFAEATERESADGTPDGAPEDGAPEDGTAEPPQIPGFDAFFRQNAEKFHFEVYLLLWRDQNPQARLHVHSSREIRRVFEELTGAMDLNWSVPHHLTNPSLRIEDCERLAALIASGAPRREIAREWRAAHRLTDLPDGGRTPARRAMIEEHFVKAIRGVGNVFGLDIRSAPERRPDQPG